MLYLIADKIALWIFDNRNENIELSYFTELTWIYANSFNSSYTIIY